MKTTVSRLQNKSCHHIRSLQGRCDDSVYFDRLMREQSATSFCSNTGNHNKNLHFSCHNRKNKRALITRLTVVGHGHSLCSQKSLFVLIVFDISAVIVLRLTALNAQTKVPVASPLRFDLLKFEMAASKPWAYKLRLSCICCSLHTTPDPHLNQPNPSFFYFKPCLLRRAFSVRIFAPFSRTCPTMRSEFIGLTPSMIPLPNKSMQSP